MTVDWTQRVRRAFVISLRIAISREREVAWDHPTAAVVVCASVAVVCFNANELCLFTLHSQIALDNMTGSESLFAEWRDAQIMFHVSTMLPFLPADPQQLARKKHIGNDRCVIVFQDGDAPLPPSIIASKQLRMLPVFHDGQRLMFVADVLAIISPDTIDEEGHVTKYKYVIALQRRVCQQLACT